jgi:hypothetical protein
VQLAAPKCNQDAAEAVLDGRLPGSNFGVHRKSRRVSKWREGEVGSLYEWGVTRAEQVPDAPISEMGTIRPCESFQGYADWPLIFNHKSERIRLRT